MRTEQQQLLIKDLCSRLPYGVRVAKGNIIYPMTGVNIALGYVELAVSERISIEDARPYLRPMSSMTEEEIKEWDNICVMMRNMPIESIPMIERFVNSKHLDYYNLIPKGFAIEAPEDMYNF